MWRFLGLLLGGASLLLSTSAAVAAPVRAALLPIAVHSADEGTAYLSAGLAEMISARLEQTGNVSVVLVPGEAVATSQVAKAIEAGKKAGVDYVVFGAFTQFGAGASLDVQCAAVNGPTDAQARRIFVQSGTLGEIIPKLDDLAAKIARYMTSGGQSAPVAAGAGPPSNRARSTSCASAWTGSNAASSRRPRSAPRRLPREARRRLLPPSRARARRTSRGLERALAERRGLRLESARGDRFTIARSGSGGVAQLVRAAAS